MPKPTATEFYIVDLRSEWRHQPYISFWRAENAGYAWPVPWAGKYDKAAIDDGKGYYTTKQGGRYYTRFAVPCDVIERMATQQPKPGLIDGNVGPVLVNDGKTRAALRRARYVPLIPVPLKQAA